MKKAIEVFIDVSDCIDGELPEILLYLSKDKINLVKGVTTGMFMVNGNISSEQLSVIQQDFGFNFIQ